MRSSYSLTNKLLTWKSHIVVMLIAVAISVSVLPLSSHASDVQVELNVQGCNNNNMCEAHLGENTLNCSNDCFVAPPTTPTSNGTSGGTHPSYANLIVSDIQVIPGATSVIITWKTNRISVGTLAWGSTSDYELGTVSEIGYTNNHSVKIENLFPHQTYYFRIDSQDTRQVVTSIKGLSFTTLALPDSSAPANISHLEGSLQNDSVQLTWRNPSDTDFNVVRVVRSTIFFPKDSNDGKVVYEGRGSYTTDSSIKADTTYYYAVFAGDYVGNYSSGAVVKIIVPAKIASLPTTEATSSIVVIPIVSDPFSQFPIAGPVQLPATTTSIKTPRATTSVSVKEALNIVDFSVKQRGENVSFSQSSIRIDERDNVTLSIGYEKLPENLKTIAVTVQDPTSSNKKYVYLLHLNKEKTAYEATLDNFERAGTYNFNITVLDYKMHSFTNLKGAFVVPHDVKETQSKSNFIQYDVVDFIIPILIFLLIIIALLLLARLLLRKIRYFTT